ncbi:MAG: hypothetical protein ABSC42_09025 [Tepidisphaeraceae bacterium]|jgi:hypothetical protein
MGSQQRSNVTSYISSATLEIRFMPPIDSGRALQIAGEMVSEVQKLGSYGTHAQLISRDDHVSISLEEVELSEMTAAAYNDLLNRLEEIARRFGQDR